MLKVYLFLSEILFPFVLLFFFIARKIQKKDTTSWKIKFGEYVLPPQFDKSKKTLMIHGVSVGEVVSLEKLIRKIKQTYNCNIVLTTGTKTGQETAVKKMSDTVDYITYFPFDIQSCADKFLNKISPDIVLIAETEIWPVFAYCCHKKNIPLYIINGRMSEESHRSYKLLKPFFKSILPLYNGIFVQSEIDKNRLIDTGADKNKIEVMKNLKFDVEKFKPELNITKGENKVLIAGSTHKGEDEIIIRAYKKLKEKSSNIKLLLAPRHITRTESVKKLLEDAKLTYNLYSISNNFEKDVLLLDVMGELSKLYFVSDVAFIGGSFNKTGGHNPLEAVIFDKPVISGPNVKNFRDIYAILSQNNAAKVVNSEKELVEYLNKLFFDKEFYEKASLDCKNVFDNQKGALEFVIGKLREYLN